MKYLLTGLVIFLFAMAASGQVNEKLSPRNSNETFSDELKKLHEQLVLNTSDDSTRVLAFYTWIAQNINYDVLLWKQEGADEFSQLPSTVLKNRKAVCHGYADLFRNLCLLSGIPSYLVSGYSRDNNVFSPEGHTWNLIFVDRKWQQVDVTWAAGFIDEANWVKEFSLKYFLSDKDTFLQEHYPFDPMWQLQEQPIKLSSFKTGKLVYSNNQSELFSYNDTIKTWIALDAVQRELQSAFRMMRHAPDDPMSVYYLNFAYIQAGNRSLDSHVEWMNKLSKYKTFVPADYPRVTPILDSATFYAKKADGWYSLAAPSEPGLKTTLKNNKISLEKNMAYIRELRKFFDDNR